MTQLIGIAIALTLALAVVPVLAQFSHHNSATVTNSIAQNSGDEGTATAGTAIVTPSASTNPSASAYAPGHGATPPGQGGTPPGQAEDDEPTGMFSTDPYFGLYAHE